MSPLTGSPIPIGLDHWEQLQHWTEKNQLTLAIPLPVTQQTDAQRSKRRQVVPTLARGYSLVCDTCLAYTIAPRECPDCHGRYCRNHTTCPNTECGSLQPLLPSDVYEAHTAVLADASLTLAAIQHRFPDLQSRADFTLCSACHWLCLPTPAIDDHARVCAAAPALAAVPKPIFPYAQVLAHRHCGRCATITTDPRQCTACQMIFCRICAACDCPAFDLDRVVSVPVPLYFQECKHCKGRYCPLMTMPDDHAMICIPLDIYRAWGDHAAQLQLPSFQIKVGVPFHLPMVPRFILSVKPGLLLCVDIVHRQTSITVLMAVRHCKLRLRCTGRHGLTDTLYGYLQRSVGPPNATSFTATPSSTLQCRFVVGTLCIEYVPRESPAAVAMCLTEPDITRSSCAARVGAHRLYVHTETQAIVRPFDNLQSNTVWPSLYDPSLPDRVHQFVRDRHLTIDAPLDTTANALYKLTGKSSENTAVLRSLTTLPYTQEMIQLLAESALHTSLYDYERNSLWAVRIVNARLPYTTLSRFFFFRVRYRPTALDQPPAILCCLLCHREYDPYNSASKTRFQCGCLGTTDLALSQAFPVELYLQETLFIQQQRQAKVDEFIVEHPAYRGVDGRLKPAKVIVQDRPVEFHVPVSEYCIIPNRRLDTAALDVFLTTEQRRQSRRLVAATIPSATLIVTLVFTVDDNVRWETLAPAVLMRLQPWWPTPPALLVSDVEYYTAPNSRRVRQAIVHVFTRVPPGAPALPDTATWSDAHLQVARRMHARIQDEVVRWQTSTEWRNPKLLAATDSRPDGVPKHPAKVSMDVLTTEKRMRVTRWHFTTQPPTAVYYVHDRLTMIQPEAFRTYATSHYHVTVDAPRSVQVRITRQSENETMRTTDHLLAIWPAM